MNEPTNESERVESAATASAPETSATDSALFGDAPDGGREGAASRATARVDRRLWSLALKTFICGAATLTLLGGSLGFSLQHLERESAHYDDVLDYYLAGPAAQQPRPAKSPRGQQPASAQSPTPEVDGIDRPVSDPYKGSLSIFEDPKREEKLQIGRVMDVLKIREGSGVADIGAGSGWFTVRAARRVGASGAVFAVEINPEFVAHIEQRAKAERLPQVRAVQGREDDPLLPDASVDAVLILKTYHEIAEPVRLMRNLRKSLRPGALVGIIDRAGKGDDHGLDSAKVIAEVGRAGYALVEKYDFVKPDGMDYFLVFGVKE